jgi:ribosomal protein S18 acetylase RimI-like enzyme
VNPTVTATRLPPEKRLEGAARLVGCPVDAGAARRFLNAAPASGVDPSLIWGTTGANGRIREVCLTVIGAGRTAMMFLSGPNGTGSNGTDRVVDRAACLRAAAEYLTRQTDTALMQALPNPEEEWAISAFEASGMTRLAELSYLRRRFVPADRRLPTAIDGFEVVSVESLGGLGAARDELLTVLDRSYEQTLDCPGLCGMRRTPDVLESHVAVGKFDPARWWLARRDGEPVACLLLNHCPELDAIELVYVGVAVSARGESLAHKLLCLGLAHTHGVGAREMTCAVDRANKPAMRLYDALGFETFANRIAVVGVPSNVARAH